MKTFFRQTIKNIAITWFSSLLLTACGSSETSTSYAQVQSTTSNISPKISTSTAASTIVAPVTSVAPTEQLDQNWEYRWLNHNPCQAPCFEGITAGKTSLKESLDILKNNTFVTNVEVDSSATILVWNWKPYTSNSSASITPSTGLIAAQNPKGFASIVYDGTIPNQVVRNISPRFLMSFTLKQIISSYGQPTNILIDARPDYDHINDNFLYDVVVLYPAQGLAITTYRPFTKRPTLNADLALNDVEFFSPERQDTLGKNVTKIVTWQGYKDFEYYCLLTDPQNNRCKS